jgi:hypothetical protein
LPRLIEKDEVNAEEATMNLLVMLLRLPVFVLLSESVDVLKS